MATSPVQSVPIQLSKAKPDFEAIVLQLQLYLSQKQTWFDMLTSSTGQTLIEMMAACTTFNQFAIESAAREGFLQTAVRASSIYAITRMLGVRISRKLPAGVAVTLTRSSFSVVDSLIPSLSQFSVNGVPFFNRGAINFEYSLTVDAVLYEGTIRTQTFPSDASTFREVYLQEPGFVVSDIVDEHDSDIIVRVVPSNIPDNGNLEYAWTNIEEGIWTAGSEEQVYHDSTSGYGDCVLSFGDGYSGKLPPLGYNIIVKYAVTSGILGNNGTSNLGVVYEHDSNIIGVTTSQVTGGADEKDKTYYKAMAPYLYRARSRAVTPADYKAIASSYTNVASVTIQAQRDIAPGDLRWMNSVRICILPADVTTNEFTPEEWDVFEEFFNDKKHALIHIKRQAPFKIIQNVSLVAALYSSANPSDVVPAINTAIHNLFAREVNTLGKHIAISDIVEAAMIDLVDYVQIVEPATDLIATDPRQYFELGDLIINVRYSERANANAGRIR